jgi:hypothetical protein
MPVALFLSIVIASYLVLRHLMLLAFPSLRDDGDDE